MNCIPGQSQTWLLSSAVNTDETAGFQDLMKWQNATDFEAHVPRSEVLLIPLIWRKYKDQLHGSPLDERFGGLFKKSFYNNSLQYHLLGQLVEVLEKGCYNYAFTDSVAVNYYLYRDHGIRTIDQINILIEPKALLSLITDLQQMGYSARYSEITPEKVTSGVYSAFILAHATLKPIYLHCFPSPFHNQKLTNSDFLEDAKKVELKGISIRLLQPEKLFVFLLLNNSFSSDWYWIADAVLLCRKYVIPIQTPRPFMEKIHLYHTTATMLEFLWREFRVGSVEEQKFYEAQPLALTDRYVMQAKNPTDLKFRVAQIVNFHGMNHEKNLSMHLINKLIIWYYNIVETTRTKEIPGKATRFFRNLLGIS